ncbi:MAG TPA: lysophospholipid acyltransferase family protein [Candidatus Binataceae bacterium]|nr:lysophospholipid acyltransferase family protein [Candidatus Binataceae bacterium]
MANGAETATLGAVSPVRLFKAVWGAIATLLCVLVTAIAGLPTAVLARLGYLKPVTFMSTVWARLLIFFCGVRLEIVGLENLRGIGQYVLVCNHQSFFDIFAVAAYMPGPIRFVAKKELMKIPLVGYSMKHGGHIIIDRQAGGKEIRNALEVARKGFSLCIFAEGHRFSDNRVHPFEDGAAWLAALTKLPAVPMAISGSGGIFPRQAKIVVPGGKMRMTIGTPIPTANLKSRDRGELTRKLEEAVRGMFVEEL